MMEGDSFVGGAAAGERTLFFSFICFPSLILTLILGGAAAVLGASIAGEAAAASITGGAAAMEGALIAGEVTDGAVAAIAGDPAAIAKEGDSMAAEGVMLTTVFMAESFPLRFAAGL